MFYPFHSDTPDWPFLVGAVALSIAVAYVATGITKILSRRQK